MQQSSVVEYAELLKVRAVRVHKVEQVQLLTRLCARWQGELQCDVRAGGHARRAQLS